MCFIPIYGGRPKVNLEKMTTLMLETFSLPALSLQGRPVLALSRTGRATRLVLTSGDAVSCTVPVDEGFGLPPPILLLTMAERVLPDRLMFLLNECGRFFNRAVLKDESV